MDEYYLFLDESVTHNGAFLDQVFCVAGVVLKKEDYENSLIPLMNDLKNSIWSDLPNPTDLVLHEKEVREAQFNRKPRADIKPHFRRFRNSQSLTPLFSGLKNILDTVPCHVLGAAIHFNTLNSYFNCDIQTTSYLTAMQIVLENYCQFLKTKNGVGHVFVESREAQDTEVRMHFHHIKAMGSLFVSPHAMQKLLRDISFPPKTENNVGLQVADFIPNPFARNTLGIKQNKHNLYQNLRGLRYDGSIGKFDRFGIKVMP